MSILKTRFAAHGAKKLRIDTADAGRILWSRLRNRQLLDHKFVRQHPVGRHIADFARREADLVVELDGGQHAQASADEERTAAHGCRVIRFRHADVPANTDGVLQTFATNLTKAPSLDLRFAKAKLSPRGRGEAAPTRTQGTQP